MRWIAVRPAEMIGWFDGRRASISVVIGLTDKEREEEWREEDAR
jgi:hypothetical protein